MKTLLQVVLILTLILSVVQAGSAYGGDNTRSFTYKNFNVIDIGAGMHLTVTQSDSYSIEATGDSEDLNDLEVEQKGNELRINFKNNSFFNFKHHHTVKFNIRMPELTGVDLSGGARGKIQMNIASKNFSADISGGAFLEGDLKCGRMFFDLSGGSRMNLKGSGTMLKIDGSGGCQFNLKELQVTDANIDLSGGSQATINMNGKLDADLGGGSHVYYFGKVELGSTDFSGGSGISKGN